MKRSWKYYFLEKHPELKVIVDDIQFVDEKVEEARELLKVSAVVVLALTRVYNESRPRFTAHAIPTIK